MGGRGANKGGSGGGMGGTAPLTQKTVQDKINDAKDLAELTTVVKDELGVTLSPSLHHADFGVLKEAMDDMNSMIDEFPILRTTFTDVDTKIGKGNAFAASSGPAVSLNTRSFYDDAAKLDRRYARTVANGFHPAGTNYRDVMVHELGHSLEWALGNKINKGNYIMNKIDWNSCAIASHIVHEACMNLKKTPFGKGKTIDDMGRGLSGYSAKNRSEFFAEAIADYYRNRGNANPVSIEIWRIAKERMNS